MSNPGTTTMHHSEGLLGNMLGHLNFCSINLLSGRDGWLVVMNLIFSSKQHPERPGTSPSVYGLNVYT